LLLGLQQKFQAGFIFSTKTHPVMIAIASAGLINIGLNLLLVPRYGYMAAAMTTLVGYIVLLAIMVISSRKYFIWDFPFRSLGRAVLSSAIMAAAIYPVGNSLTSSPILNLTAAISIGLVLYFALLILFGEIQPGEKRLLTVLLTRLNLYERYRSNWRR
jgi:O-antigen/teichoic acid export membrane protein